MLGVDNQAFDGAKEERSKGSNILKNGKFDGKSSKEGSTEAVPEESLDHDPKVARIILKNIIIISIAFTFLFTAFNSMVNLQSSINKTVGTVSLATIYAALVVSCCFLPSLLIKTLKTKYVMAVCMLGYSSYIAAQFHPTLETMVPTAILLGLGAAPMWSAKCSYLTQVGTKYAELTGQDKEVVITRYFGIFFLFFQSTQVWGNLISSSVLSTDTGVLNKTDEELETCGYNFCLATQNATNGDDGIPNWQRYTMASIYLVCALLSSVIIVVFVDPLRRFVDKEETAATEGKSPIQLLIATFNHMRHPYQLLIIPLTIWSGVEQGFFQSDFTAAYVSCGLGVHMVGYVMICYGVCDALCSISFSPLVRLVGRVPVFIVGAVINYGVIITLIKWRPHPDDTAIFFVLAGLWGVSDAVWQTQINAFYGVIFPGKAEAAFSNYRLWESAGFIITFACSTVLCIQSKITIVLAFLSVGMVGYCSIEIIDRFVGIKKDSDGEAVPIDRLVTGKY
ncbi:UNC93-like protein isoform X2 [Portunus trituberculatus]|nr:UNC93-like protein isoform X2 [Portunus trituberculatus]